MDISQPVALAQRIEVHYVNQLVYHAPIRRAYEGIERREEAEEEGIEINEDSINNAMHFLHYVSPPGNNLSEEPSRLLEHKKDGDVDDDEWKLP